MAGVQRATRRPRLGFILGVSTISLLILCSQASRDRRQEERQRRDILGSTEIPAEHIDPAAIDLTPLVNTLINTSQSGSRQLFSLLSVTSYSSLALHKLTLLVYNISSIKSLESNTFRRRFCYCVTNETNDLTDFTAILLDVMGNSTSYLHELFKSASILSVSQRNNSECIYICVMAGKMGRAVPELWEVGSVRPLFNQTIVEGPHRVGNISSIRLPLEWHQLPNNLSHISPSGMSSVLTSRVQSTAHVSPTTMDETAATTAKITSAQQLATSPQPATAMPQSQTTADRLETTAQRMTTQRVMTTQMGTTQKVTTQAVTAAQTTDTEKTTIAQPITSTQPTTILQVPNASVTTAAAPTTETIPPTTETAPQTTETAPQTTETAPSTTETVPPTTETAPSTTETVPPTTETAPSTTETVPPITETAPSTTETVPPTTETVPPTTETAPSTTETVPPTTETAPSTTETAPSTTETAPPTTETARPTTERVSSTTGTARQTTGTAPSTTKTVPSTTKRSLSTTETAPPITVTSPLITPLSTTRLTTASTNPTTSSPVISPTRLTTATHQPTTKTQRMTSTVHPTRLSTGRPTAGPTEVRRTTGSLSWRTTTPSKSVETEKPGCPWRRTELADIPLSGNPLSGATTTVGAHKLQPCVLELCKFFSQCLCRPSGNKTRMKRYCDDSHLWYEKHTLEVCRRVRRVSFSRNLKQRCLTKMCSKL
ncbi:uncharacterized protein LOC120567839 [Perca fluviatilis]|uniref:uncharacterized protein LOC120567839 n=1 Tax=Perca fluviatilis TaxID=8168 RepID=UPI0019631F4E|nr:uncharacterized protein LOC120567839 [Perca fluviatilis]